MAAFTSKATGLWSAAGQTTWNEVGVPGATDTVAIGAHTVTVDVDTTIGTSPNDNTTKVVDKTSATGALIVATGVTFTVRGNIGGVNSSVFTMQAGSTLIFDNALSGGTPVYKFINAGFQVFNLNGSSGSRVTLQAIVGQTFAFNVAMGLSVATFATFRRCSNSVVTSMSGGFSFTDCIFDTCASINWTTTANSTNWIFDRNSFIAGTGATDAVFNWSVAAVSGTRRIASNIFLLPVTYNAKSFVVTQNYFGGGITCPAGSTTTSFRLNFSKQDGTLNSGNGAVFPSSFERNYFIVDNAIGNPHFVAAQATVADNTVSQNIFEGHVPDLIDPGDCLLIISTAVSGGFKVIGKNNIVLPSSSANVSSGCLLTLFNAASTTLSEWYRNTGNVDKSAVGGLPNSGKRGMFAIAEGGTGFAGQVGVLKSNVAWGSSASQGFLGERVTGNVKDIITEAGADRNWTYNLSAGDNQRSYEDVVAANTLWTAGDAVAASVDVNQGTGNPSFFDSARNLASWVVARGYGATYADGLTALQADLTRIADLINHIFEGYRPANASMRNAAHDGGCVGAANYYKVRGTAMTTAHRATLAKFGL